MTRPKMFIVVAIIIGACTAGMIHLARLHAQTAAASHQKRTSYAASTAFPGFATPENTLRSLGWAAREGDLELLRDAVTSDIQMMLNSGGPAMVSHALSTATALGGAKVLNKEILSDEEVMLSVQVEGKDSPWKLRMAKIEGNWKLSALTP